MTVTKNLFSVSSPAKPHKQLFRAIKILTHRSRNGSNSPAERVEVVPRPFGSVDLLCQLFCKNGLGVGHVKVSQVNKQFAH